MAVPARKPANKSGKSLEDMLDEKLDAALARRDDPEAQALNKLEKLIDRRLDAAFERHLRKTGDGADAGDVGDGGERPRRQATAPKGARRGGILSLLMGEDDEDAGGGEE